MQGNLSFEILILQKQSLCCPGGGGGGGFPKASLANYGR